MTMINWKKAKSEQPKDGLNCWLTTEGGSTILGTFPYSEKERMWIDLFATPEAGHVYTVDSEDYDLWWCAAEEINMPEEKT